MLRTFNVKFIGHISHRNWLQQFLLNETCKRSRQLFMTLRKLENTANWKRKCGMAIFEEYAVEETLDLSQDRLGYNDNK